MILEIFFSIIILATAIILLYSLTFWMIQSKKILEFLPFFVLGILLCLWASLNFYGYFDKTLWFIFESLWGVLFLWILINLGGKK